MLLKLLPGVGEGDRFGVPDQKGDPQLFLQLDDLLGKGGLGQVELFGRLGDALFRGDFQKILQLLNLHESTASRFLLN